MADFQKIKQIIDDSDCVLVTAGNGFAIADGFDMLSESLFSEKYPDLKEKYGMKTIADALDQNLPTWDEKWGLWRRFIHDFTEKYQPSQTMLNLKQLLANKDYFIATSYFTHAFENAGFDEKRIFNIFGDWTTMACSSGINHGLKSDLATAGVPKCDMCNSEMEIHLPLTAHFYPDTDANTRMRIFITNNEDKKMAVIELGVDETSPQLLDPIAHLVSEFASWQYLAADLQTSDLPDNLAKRSIACASNSAEFLKELTK